MLYVRARNTYIHTYIHTYVHAFAFLRYTCTYMPMPMPIPVWLLGGGNIRACDGMRRSCLAFSGNGGREGAGL
jgi:hypothetical protein